MIFRITNFSIRIVVPVLLAGLLVTERCAPPEHRFGTEGNTGSPPEPHRIHGRTSGWIEHGSYPSTFLPGRIPMPVLPVQVGSERLLFLLDTGSPFTIVPGDQIPPERIEKKLSERTTIRYPGSEQTLAFVLLSSLRIGRLVIERAKAGSGSVHDPRFSGIIGMTILRDVTLRIDNRRRRTRLSREPVKERPGRTVGVELVEERISVPVTIEGRGPFRFYLDTGSEITALRPDLADELRPSRSRPDPETGVELIHLEAMKAGDISLGSTSAIVLNNSQFTGNFRGILGMNAFQDSVLTIDVDRGLIRVR